MVQVVGEFFTCEFWQFFAFFEIQRIAVSVITESISDFTVHNSCFVYEVENKDVNETIKNKMAVVALMAPTTNGTIIAFVP